MITEGNLTFALTYSLLKTAVDWFSTYSTVVIMVTHVGSICYFLFNNFLLCF